MDGLLNFPILSRLCQRRAIGCMFSARIDAKLAAASQSVLSGTDDARLTNDELRRKYEVAVEMPSSPRLGASPGGLKSRKGSVTLPSFHQTQLLPTIRCFACDTNLRDPGVGWFACGACGAMNGAGEPRINRAFDGCVFRGMCRSLSRHGRTVVLAVIGLITYVIVEGVTRLLPLLVDESPWTRTSLLHRGLTCVLASGTAFNYAATLLTRPGIIEHELNPLRCPDASAKRCGGKEKDEAEAESHLPLEIVRPTPLSPESPAPRSRPSTQATATAHSVGAAAAAPMPLSRLVALRGEQPLRGWKKCEETGLSLPPRAHYCRTCKAMVKRMDHHCMFTNACVGHANQHYFVTFLAFLSASTLYVICATTYALCATRPPSLFTDTFLLPHTAAAAPHPDKDPRQAELAAAMSTLQTLGLSPPMALVSFFATSAARTWPFLGPALRLYAACFPAFLFSTFLLLLQTRNLLRGLTYIESCKTPPPTDYDLDPRQNIAQVFGGFGPRLLLHLLPVPRAAIGDGVSFPMRAPVRRV